LLQGILTRKGAADHLDIWIYRQEADRGLNKFGVIVCQENADGHIPLERKMNWLPGVRGAFSPYRARSNGLAFGQVTPNQSPGESGKT